MTLDARLSDGVVQSRAAGSAATAAGAPIDRGRLLTVTATTEQAVGELAGRATTFSCPVYLWPVMLALSAAAVLLVVNSPSAPAIRAGVALWFLVVCPGMAAVRLLGLGSWLAEWTLAVALSLALAATVAEIMVYRGSWSSPHGLLALAIWTLVGSTLQVARAVGRR